MRALGRPAVRIELWDKRPAWESRDPPRGTIRLSDRATLWRFLVDPEQGVAAGYVSGRVELQGDLVGLLAEAYRASRRAPLGQILRRPKLKRSRNRGDKARSSAARPPGADRRFFARWLDPRLVHTSAYFAEPTMTLEDAQLAKLEHVCRKLDLRPGQRLVDASCGWGALALHAAEHHGVTVRAFNRSREQIEFARGRARDLGLQTRIEFIEDDYRNVVGSCDAFSAIGMLEQLALRDYASLRRVIDRCLDADGRGLLHFIGRARPTPMDGWIDRELFPGAYFPSLQEMLDILGPADMAVLDVENLRPHFVRTLELWLENFESSAHEIENTYGAAFLRRWRLYLAASAAAFRTGTCQLFQVTFARAQSHVIPAVRPDFGEGAAPGPRRATG